MRVFPLINVPHGRLSWCSSPPRTEFYSSGFKSEIQEAKKIQAYRKVNSKTLTRIQQEYSDENVTEVFWQIHGNYRKSKIQDPGISVTNISRMAYKQGIRGSLMGRPFGWVLEDMPSMLTSP